MPKYRITTDQGTYEVTTDDAPATPDYSVSGFLGNVADSAANFAKGIYGAVRHPIDTAAGLATVAVGAMPYEGPPGSFTHDVAVPRARQVGEFYKQRYGGLQNIKNTLYNDPVGAAADASTLFSGAEGALRGGAALSELGGLDAMANAARTGAKVAGKAAKYTNPLSLPVGTSRFIGNRISSIPSSLNPVEAAAVDYALKDPTLGPTVDAATASGNGYLNSAKAVLQKSPLSSGIAGDAAQAQQTAIASKMGDLANSVSPGGARTRLTAGVSTQGKVSAQLGQYRQAAQQNYNDLFAAADRNPQTIQIGTRPNPTLDPTAPDTLPVMSQVRGPVSTAGVKAAAGALLDELEKTLPEAQRQMSPSVSLLRQIVKRPDVVDLETAISDNSALQNLARTETPQLRTQAQRIAATLVSPYRDAIDAGAQALGPEAFQALQDGRAATAAKYDLGDLLSENLRDKPAKFIKYLTSGDDVSYPALATLAQHAPAAIPDIARATLESVFKHSTENGGVSKIDGTINKWNGLGEETKRILFGPDTSQEVTNLLQYAKQATRNANPSGSATVGSAAALTAMLFRDPVTALAMMAGSRALARKMFDPALAAQLRQTGKLTLVKPGRVAGTVRGLLNPTALNAAGTVRRGLLGPNGSPITTGLLAQ